MEDFLFSSNENPNRLRLFRLGKEWHECFVVEFTLSENHYEHLYWGNQVYVEKDRYVISLMLTIAFLPDSHDEWKKVNIEKMKIGIDFKTILSQVENDIKSILD
jgi:hypothetical protein